MPCWCPRCGQFCLYGRETHECPPMWIIREPYYDGDVFDENTRKYHATVAEEAVRRWAVDFDAKREYVLAKGGVVKVYVRRVGAADDTQEEFEVWGEPTVEYRACSVSKK